jgi:hypothetical protein
MNPNSLLRFRKRKSGKTRRIRKRRLLTKRKNKKIKLEL